MTALSNATPVPSKDDDSFGQLVRTVTEKVLLTLGATFPSGLIVKGTREGSNERHKEYVTNAPPSLVSELISKYDNHQMSAILGLWAPTRDLKKPMVSIRACKTSYGLPP